MSGYQMEPFGVKDNLIGGVRNVQNDLKVILKGDRRLDGLYSRNKSGQFLGHPVHSIINQTMTVRFESLKRTNSRKTTFILLGVIVTAILMRMNTLSLSESVCVFSPPVRCHPQSITHFETTLPVVLYLTDPV